MLHVDLKFEDGHVIYQSNIHQLIKYKVSLPFQVLLASLDIFTVAAQNRAPVRVRFVR